MGCPVAGPLTDWEPDSSYVDIIAILATCNNAAYIVAIAAAAWSIIQPRTSYVTGREVQIEVSWEDGMHMILGP